MTQATTATTAYPLTPMQEGMLFDCLSTEDPGVHLEQIVLTLEESIDVSALVEAWQVVANRYDVFRTAFSWSEGSPSQSITDAVEIPCTIHNWQSLAPEAQQERLEGLLRQDRAQGIDLAQAPAMRVTVIRFGPQRYRCVWTFHHLVLDGRSFATVLSEVFEAYAELADGRSLSSHADPMAFADYVAWTGTLDHSSSEAFWREFLQGVRAATPLLPSTPDDPAAAPGDRIGFVERKLSASTRARLDEIATTAGCSLNTIVQGAWAILLGRHSGERDVVFGATRAARRTALPGATDMVGLLINTLPVRASIDWDGDLIPWLQTLRRQQDAVRAHEHTPLVEVQRWSDVPAGSALFDSVLISDREELGAELRRRGGAWASRDALLIEQTTQKLTWYVYAEEEPVIRLGYDRRHFSKLTANRITDQLVTLVESIAADPGRTLGALDYIGADERAALSFSEQGPIVAFDARTPVHRLFEAQVARTPDAAALSCLDEQVTYA
ncbi:MAG: non-ribosomal peptide synthetase, partial [Dehalococcoidia bacterium]|nr:non-ribosomal peptide synthetase [Dehalococcoidia bacterium]